MAVPKRRLSRANTHARRSAWKAAPVELVQVRIQGVEYKIPRRLVKGVQLGLIDPDRI